jgi:hypothetical protein
MMAKLIRRFEDGVGFVYDYTGPHYDETTAPIGRVFPYAMALGGSGITPTERALDRWADDGGYCPPYDER